MYLNVALRFFVVTIMGMSLYAESVHAVAPVFETNRHIGQYQAWDFPGRWGPYPSPEAACRAEVWVPSSGISGGYPDNNYRGLAATSNSAFYCFCHSNFNEVCGYAWPRCPPGFSSGVGAHIDNTPFGPVALSDWASGCMLTGPDPLKPRSQCAGNPIDIGTGAKIQRETDIAFTGAFGSYSIQRNYVFDKGSRPNGSVGKNWWLNLDVRLIYQDVLNHEYATIYLPSGRGYRYEKINGLWQTSSDEGEKIVLLEPIQEGGNWTFETGINPASI